MDFMLNTEEAVTPGEEVELTKPTAEQLVNLINQTHENTTSQRVAAALISLQLWQLGKISTEEAMSDVMDNLQDADKSLKEVPKITKKALSGEEVRVVKRGEGRDFLEITDLSI